MSPPSDTRRLGAGMLTAMWVLVLALLTWLFSGVLDRQENPNGTPAVQVGRGGAAEVTLVRNHYGHYVADGTIDGRPVTFMVDTGASDIAIPSAVAHRLGLRAGPAQNYQTANGTAVGYLTRLASVSLGGITLTDIGASISPGMDSDTVLLGMTFLKRLEFTQRGDTLILRAPRS